MKQQLEKILNRYLMLDPESSQRIALLQGKKVTLELKGISLVVQMIFTADAIQLKWDDFSDADLTIRGTPLSLLHMSMTHRDKRQPFFAEDIIIEGNVELAESVLTLFDELELDWEELFSQWVGDVPAHKTGRLLRGLKKWGQQFRDKFAYNTNEFIHEEINLSPPTEALKHFFQDVDELRMDVDRLDARVEKLNSELKMLV